MTNAPTVHPADDLDAAAQLAVQLSAPERARTGTGLHVVVLVTDSGNTAYGRLVDAASIGNGSQRWVRHARRGASPGGWSEEHHPRGEQDLGAWREAHASQIDRLLIQSSKQAWALDGTTPYVVELPPIDFAAQ